MDASHTNRCNWLIQPWSSSYALCVLSEISIGCGIKRCRHFWTLNTDRRAQSMWHRDTLKSRNLPNRLIGIRNNYFSKGILKSRVTQEELCAAWEFWKLSMDQCTRTLFPNIPNKLMGHKPVVNIGLAFQNRGAKLIDWTYCTRLKRLASKWWTDPIT